MTTSQQRLRRFGLIGLTAGAILVLGAPVAGTELAGLLRGYGFMLATSAVYLFGGLWVTTLPRVRRAASEKLEPRQASPQP